MSSSPRRGSSNAMHSPRVQECQRLCQVQLPRVSKDTSICSPGRGQDTPNSLLKPGFLGQRPWMGPGTGSVWVKQPRVSQLNLVISWLRIILFKISLCHFCSEKFYISFVTNVVFWDFGCPSHWVCVVNKAGYNQPYRKGSSHYSHTAFLIVTSNPLVSLVSRGEREREWEMRRLKTVSTHYIDGWNCQNWIYIFWFFLYFHFMCMAVLPDANLHTTCVRICGDQKKALVLLELELWPTMCVLELQPVFLTTAPSLQPLKKAFPKLLHFTEALGYEGTGS